MIFQEPRHTASTKHTTHRRGFTLAEALIASVFLAIATIGVAGTIAASSHATQQLSQSANCQALAKELLEEVSSKSFTTQPNQGYSAGTTSRVNYDDVADYNGYTDNSTSGIKTLDGSTVAFGDGATYTRTVAFEYRASPGGTATSSGDFGLVTVKVTSSTGPSITLQRVLSNSSYARKFP